MATSRKGEFGTGNAGARGETTVGKPVAGVVPSAMERFPSSGEAPKPEAPSGAPTTALERHYASNPGQRGVRPFKPHAEIDAEGNQNQLTPTQTEANKTAEAAAAEFDANQNAKKSGKPAPAAGGAGSTGGGRTRPIMREPQQPKKPTNRTTGVHVPQEMGIKEFSQKVAGMHTILDAHAKSVQSLKLRPQASDDVNDAVGHLGDAKFHIGEAEKARRGIIVGNKRYSGDAEAGKHYISALGSIRKAHDLLSGEHVSHAAYLNNLSVELPTQHLNDLEGASKTIPILKGAGSFKKMEFGGIKVDPNAIDVKAAEGVLGKDSEAVRKIRAGQRGVAPRQDKFKVVTGQEEKVLGGLPGPEVRTTGRKGVVGSVPNPKRKASKTRSVDTRMPNANMSRFQTPTFDATSAVEGGDEGMTKGGKK